MTSTPTILEIARRHSGLLAAYVAQISPDDVLNAVAILRRARESGRPVYVAGNGGSAANASHLVLHLRQAGLHAVDLGQGPLVTALGNDHGQPAVFAGQVPHGHDYDLVVFSCSGDSPNILSLLKCSHAGLAIGILGFDGGKALDLCDAAIVVRGTDYGVLEDAHSYIVHLIAEVLLEGKYR